MKDRLSNIELCRIISMFFICTIHANMVSLCPPTKLDLYNSTLPTITRFFIESVGIVGVNIFIFISGWFTLQAKKTNFLKLVYQILFLWGGTFAVMVIMGGADLRKEPILDAFLISGKDWFILSYFVLIIISPVLNIYIKNSPELLQRKVLLLFFLFEFTYGAMGGAKRFMLNGYTPLAFIGVYLLSQYVHNTNYMRTPVKIRQLFVHNRIFDICVYLVAVILNTLLAVFSLKYDLSSIHNICFSYINPLNIIGSLYLFLFFTKLDIGYNKLVNWFASGSFAVYLLHGQTDLRPIFTCYVQLLYDNYSGISCIFVIFVFLVLVFLFSVVIDQFRIASWKLFVK